MPFILIICRSSHLFKIIYLFDKVIRFYPIFDLSNNKKQPIMKTFIIYLTSFAGLENEYETRYEVVADCIGNALNYAKGQHKHNVSEYDYWTLDTDNWND